MVYFLCLFRIVAVDCGGTILAAGMNGTIYSPGYPNGYTQGAQCSWIIKVSTWGYIQGAQCSWIIKVSTWGYIQEAQCSWIINVSTWSYIKGAQCSRMHLDDPAILCWLCGWLIGWCVTGQ